MNPNNFNSLVDLFLHQVEKEKSQEIFLEWLNPVNRRRFTWSETASNVIENIMLYDYNNNILKNNFKKLNLKTKF